MKLNLLVATLILGFAGMVLAADEPAAKPQRGNGVFGKIVKVEGSDITVAVPARGDKEAKEVVVKTNDQTKVTVDKKEAKVADLKEGMFIRAKITEGVAERIAANTKAPERRQPKK